MAAAPVFGLVTAVPRVTHPSLAGARAQLPALGTLGVHHQDWPRASKAKQSLKLTRYPLKWGSGLHQMCQPSFPNKHRLSVLREASSTELSEFCHHSVRRALCSSGFQLQMKQMAKH